MEDRRIQASYLQIDKGIFANAITATGDLIASGNFQSSGTGIFSALDLNNIDILSLSGVDVNITSGNIALTNRPTVNGTGVLLSGDIPYVQTNSYFYVDATRTDSYIENGNILYPYKTLSGAYNAAKNIAYFHNPTYITLLSPIAENLTIDKGYINLVGNNTNKNDPIRITGSLVFAATGIGSTITDNNFSIAGLGITATSNNKCILFSGNNPQRLFIQDCWLIAKDNGTCLYSNNTNTTSRLQGDILKLSPEGVNTTAIDIVSGTSSISFAETSSSASVLAYVRNNSTLNISNSQIETAGAKAFQVENAARLTLLNSVLTNTANPSTGIFLKDPSSTAVVVGSAISVPANANSYAINGVANSYLFYKNLYFSIDAIGGSTESKIGNNVNKNLINSYDPVVYSIGDQTISGIKTFDVFPIVSGNKLITGVDLSSYATTANLALTGNTLTNNITSLSGLFTGYTGALDNTYATDIQLFNTGSTLQTNINNLSNTYATITNLASTGSTLATNLANTGSTLNSNIISLSGLFTGYTGALDATFASDSQLFTTGSTLNSKINNLSGVSVLTYGNQTITGIKTFRDTILVDQSSVVLSGSVLTLAIKIVTGSTVTVTQPDYAETQVIDYIENDVAITRGTNGGPYNPIVDGSWDGNGPAYTTWNADGWNDLSNIQSRTYLASMQNTMNNNFAAITNYYFVMHDTQNDRYYKLKFNSWQVGAGQEGGYKGFSYTRTLVELISPQINGSNVGGNLNLSNRLFINGTGVLLSGEAGKVPNTIVQTSGAQTITGIKTFNAPTIFNSGTTFNSAAIFNNNITVAQTGIFSSMDVYVDEMNISGLNLVLTSGTGIFNNDIDLKNSRVLNASNLAYLTGLASTGSTLNNSIISLSGLFTGYTGTLDTIFASDIQLFNTGSTLQTNINNLSGYVNSSSSNILFTTGNQIISGLKTFNTGLSTTYISGVSGSSLNILGYSDSVSAQTLRSINITAGSGTSTINAGDIILIGGNLSGVAPNILKTGASITIGGAKTTASSPTTADITIKPSIDQNGTAGNIVLEAGAYTTYNGKINMFGDININGTSDASTALSSKNINIYRRGDFLGLPQQRLAVSIDNNNVNFQNGMGLQVSGVQVTPALYATSANLASTGSTLDNKISSLSGTLTSNYATITNLALTGSTLVTNLASTGSTLNSSINSLSGTLTSTYATITNLASTGNTLVTNLANTGSTLNSNINSLSGTLTGNYLTTSSASSTYATITNLASTGSTLQTNINNLSGYINSTSSNIVFTTGDQTISGIKTFNSRPTLNGTGFLLSGEAAQVDLSTTVRTTGNQTISGIKTFASRPTVNSTGILFSGEAAPKDIGTTINISSNTISLDLSTFSYFLVNLNNNITTTNFNNPKAAPEVTNFVLQLSGDGTIRSVTWPTSLRWPGSTAPTITIGPNKVDTYSIFSYDGGVSYYGFPAGYNS